MLDTNKQKETKSFLDENFAEYCEWCSSYTDDKVVTCHNCGTKYTNRYDVDNCECYDEYYD